MGVVVAARCSLLLHAAAQNKPVWDKMKAMLESKLAGESW
jgi:hypothetical protein